MCVCVYVCVCPLGFSIQSGGEGSSCGQVTRPLKPGRDGFLFLPQRSYVTEGTFLEQVVYPDKNSGNVETAVLDACRTAGLEKVCPER